jgi:hypothetical protein
MNSELLRQALNMMEDEVRSRPSAMEFEMAYQARVAIDRIRFAIRHTEQFGARSDQMREASLQLLDAVDRLESAERNFQKRFRTSAPAAEQVPQTEPINGQTRPCQRGSV